MTSINMVHAEDSQTRGVQQDVSNDIVAVGVSPVPLAHTGDWYEDAPELWWIYASEHSEYFLVMELQKVFLLAS